MITSLFELEDGNQYGFSCPEDDVPKWSRDTRHLFNAEFKSKCLILLCVQKYYAKHIDKNIFFLLMEKIAQRNGNRYFVSAKPFYELLYYMKNIEIEKIYKMIKMNTLIYGKGFEKTDMKEYFPTIYTHRNHYPLEILKRDNMLGIIEVNRGLHFYVLKDDKISKLTVNFEFDFFTNKKKQRQLFDLLKYNLPKNIVKNSDEFQKYSFLILLIILIFYIFY